MNLWGLAVGASILMSFRLAASDTLQWWYHGLGYLWVQLA